jgi:hypothetical protein
MFYSQGKLSKLIKSIFTVILSAIMFFNSAIVVIAAQPKAKTEVIEQEASTDIITLKDTPLLFTEIDYVTSYDTVVYYALIDEIQECLLHLNVAIASGTYTADACERMEQEIIRLEAINTKAELNIDRIYSWTDEYYYAAKTWLFFIQRGYSEAVVSAILGNMMIETSGGTLWLKPFVYDHTGNYYGLCQWSLYYRPEAAGMTFEEQLEYLAADMEKEFNAFGSCYRRGFTYEDFLNMTDPGEAARAFAMVYERCGSAYYIIRMQAAQKAYNYFSLEQ